MDFLRKLRRPSPEANDRVSTPRAPRMRNPPLPDVGDLPPPHNAGMGDGSERYPSPVSPPHQVRRRSESVSVARSNAPRHSERSMRTPHTPAHFPELVAPTPMRSAKPLLEAWSRTGSPDPDNLLERSRTISMQSQPRASSSRHRDRDIESPETLRRRLHSSTPQTSSQSYPPSSRTSRLSRTHSQSDSSPEPVQHQPYPRSDRTGPRHSDSTSPRPDSQTRPPLKSILKKAPPRSALSETASLHWQLLPYNAERCKKKIHFDVAMDPREHIRDHRQMPPLTLAPTDFKKAAADLHLTQMLIKVPQLPHWDIEVENLKGITCGNVYDAIYETLNLRLTEEEQEEYIPSSRRRIIERAFKKRCDDLYRADRFAEERGLLRVDLLEGQREFMGLLRPPEGGDYWVLQLGLPAKRS